MSLATASGEKPAVAASAGQEQQTTAACAPAVQEVRARLAPLAGRVARLGSLAHFLGGMRRHRGAPELDLMPLFESARESIRGFQQAVAEGGLDVAEKILGALAVEMERIERIVGAEEAPCSARSLEAYLTLATTVGAETLARVMDYYLEHEPRPRDAREKLRVLGMALARRDGLATGELDPIKDGLRRRRLFRSTWQQTPDPAMAARALELRQAIHANLEDPAELERLAIEVDLFAGEIGDAFDGFSGFAEALSLSLALDRARFLVERREALPFDDLVRDLEGVYAEFEVEDIHAGEAMTFDDTVGLALLDTIEQELRQAVIEGVHAEHGFLLEAEEVQAVVAADPADAETAAVLIESAACRSAIDRIARLHARGVRPDGPEPERVPVATAATLLHRAAALEVRLQERVNAVLLTGEIARAKGITRAVHRLSRARLGLGLLADLVGCDRQTPEMTGADRTAGGGDEGLRQQLAQMKAVRDALGGDARTRSHPLRWTATAARERFAWCRDAVRRRKLLLRTLAASLLVAVPFHLIRGIGGAPSRRFDPQPFTRAAPVTAVAPLPGTFVAVATPEWAGMADAAREGYVRALWVQARPRGFYNLIVMGPDGNRPLAFASAEGIRVLPLSGQIEPPPQSLQAR